MSECRSVTEDSLRRWAHREASAGGECRADGQNWSLAEQEGPPEAGVATVPV